MKLPKAIWYTWGSHADNIKSMLDSCYFSDDPSFDLTKYICSWTKLHQGRLLLAVLTGDKPAKANGYCCH